jgi:RNA polymerase sigma factor (sigma-70 family)
MECSEITQVTIALEILQQPEKKDLQQRLFHCIYKLFHQSFLNWILGKYHFGSDKEKLYEDAKDAFQNGLATFYMKAQKKDFIINGSLKTTIYSFGLLQLLALFKKDKIVHDAPRYLSALQLLICNEMLEKEKERLLTERENALMECLDLIPEKQKNILMMKFFMKLRSRQISEILKITPGTVDNESAKAYKQLRKRLGEKLQAQKQVE